MKDVDAREWVKFFSILVAFFITIVVITIVVAKYGSIGFFMLLPCLFLYLLGLLAAKAGQEK